MTYDIEDYYVQRDGYVRERATGLGVGDVFRDDDPGFTGWNALCGYSTLYKGCGERLCQQDRTPLRRHALQDLINHYETHRKA